MQRIYIRMECGKRTKEEQNDRKQRLKKGRQRMRHKVEWNMRIKKGRLRKEQMKMREGRADLYKDEHEKVCGSGKCR